MRFHTAWETKSAVYDCLVPFDDKTSRTRCFWSWQWQITGVCTFTTISSHQCHKITKTIINCLLDLSAAFDTIDHNILITRLSPWFGINGSVLSRCSSLTYHLAPFVLNMITTSLSLTLPLVVFPQGSVLGTVLFGMYTLSLSALWSLTFLLTTTFTQMILSSSSLSTHSTLTQAFLTFKTLFNTSLPGWLLIFLHLTPLWLNSCSSDSKNN